MHGFSSSNIFNRVLKNHRYLGKDVDIASWRVTEREMQNHEWPEEDDFNIVSS